MAEATYRLDQIVDLTGYPARTVRYYIERGLLSGPEPRGVATTYTQEQLTRLFAIKHLREVERLRLDTIRKRLARMSEEEIAALLPPPPAPASPPVRPLPAMPIAYVRWDYVELIPGLELRVRSDAGPVLRRLANEIHEQYAVSARGEEQDPRADGP